MRQISETEYFSAFGENRENALKQSWEIRKFEIELYWKRAAYFWTFIAAALAGYAAIQASSNMDLSNKQHLSIVLCCLGFVFSFAWYCVNRGSKQWQENWENHVDMLETDFVGPLYKIKMQRKPESGARARVKYFLVGPAPFSVSKINQLISIYVTSLWIILFLDTLISSFDCSAYITGISLCVGAVAVCWGIWKLGRTDQVSYEHEAYMRESHITPREL